MTDTRDLLRYDEPPTTWTEALPLGSGLLGAMCWGTPGGERIQFNHTAAWSGGPASERAGHLPAAEVARAAIAASRAAVARGDWRAADAALGAIQHHYPQSFLPVADLRIGVGDGRAGGGGRVEGEDGGVAGVEGGGVAGVDGGAGAAAAGGAGVADDDPDAGAGADADAGPGAVRGYRRTLDLSRAVHETAYELDGTRVHIVTRASHPHGVALVTVASSRPIPLTLSVDTLVRVTAERDARDGRDVLLRLPSDVEPDKRSGPHPIHYSDGDQEALDGAVVVRWDHDGAPAGPLAAAGVTRAEIWLAIETSATTIGGPLTGTAEEARERALARVERARGLGAHAVAAAQEADHRALYERCSIELGEPADEPVKARLDRAFARGSEALDRDPGLIELLFRFGRYLLICSSREGGRPANLQGIWNDRLQPPWSSDYTSNINLEMNYWLAEQTGLVECLPPLFEYIEALARSGAETADRVFGLPGWVAFHCSDAWAYTQSVGDGTHDPSWAFWPFAGPWLLQHLRERLLHGGGREVAERAWPLVRGCAEFHLAFLVENADGTLGTSPSTSPENHFTAPDGTRGATAASSTMDISLTRDLLRFVGELAVRLGHEQDPVAVAAAAALPRLPAPVIGPDGLVAEWADPRLVPDPDHRHSAHLYFVHPSDAPYDEELARAARASLDARGDESTGWSLVWRAAMRARLRDRDGVARLLRRLIRDARVWRGPYVGGLYPNLFAAHPPFQIDANLGLVAAVAECLVDSHAGVIDLLPATPDALGPGTARGLVARPGVVVDLAWDADGLVAATLTPRADGPLRVRHGERLLERHGVAGTPLTLTRADLDGADRRTPAP